MKPNIGGVDRLVRVVVGFALIGLAVAGVTGMWGWIGVVLVLTGAFRFCPAYALLGMRTCKADEA